MPQAANDSEQPAAGHSSRHISRVWDLPTRLFHWGLAVGVISLLITGLVGGNAMMWHFRFGYFVFTLLLFRLVWGFVGGTWSRFRSFIYRPQHVMNYMKGRRVTLHEVGHNPLGGLSVLAMLIFLLLQVATGLFSDDEIAASGPLTKFVATATVQGVTNYHINVGKYILIFLIVVHIVAIIFYLTKKRENLIMPMIHGDKDLPMNVPATRDTHQSRFMALLVFAMCAIAVYVTVSLGG